MNSNWQNRILQHTATPPEGAWHNIAQLLDEETGFAVTLAGYEAEPPADAQKNIFALLDSAENTVAFEKKIYDFETAPPRTAWPNIVTVLDNEKAKIVPLETVNKKSSPVYLRAAAAIAVIAVISTVLWLMNRGNNNVVTGKTAAVDAQTQNNPVQKNETAAVNTAPQQKDIAATSPQNSAVRKTNTIAPVYVQSSEDVSLAPNPATGKKDKLQSVTGETPEDIAALNTPNSYITISGPDGEPLRVSSKFSNLISYLTEKDPAVQENLDVIIKESAKWKATFAAWREKMINNAVAPSLTNFMDIIELSDVLEDKK